jgi:hypothetical protein
MFTIVNMMFPNEKHNCEQAQKWSGYDVTLCSMLCLLSA